jgi:LysR family hydrogen peroxide-inducible transcriptional activator
VGAGFGTTLVPALALPAVRAAGERLAVRELSMPGAERLVRLVFRRSYPRPETLRAIQAVLVENLPAGVDATAAAVRAADAGPARRHARRRRGRSR